ncbi:Serine/threonine-protein kinase AfsK [Actinomadura rubteroloni]|uniref:non-specific serine/threonine protein kinase n=1 Tax=Actinomadura rubteroloni TaxID=1926885 RepID=A0A2P4UGG9_9ACTN|nr:serine/threonine protein kinase [Actinomadura rubteroloni]POM24106.1 Serine/threonine-protein kinase AfsK [Actinomadura rubteroloni]
MPHDSSRRSAPRRLHAVPRPERGPRERGVPLGPDDPRRIGRYRLSGRLDDQTFLGRSPEGAAVAVRRLRGEGRAAGRARNRAAAFQDVTGRHVAHVLHAGVSEGRAFVVTEFVDGPSLAASVAAGGPLAGAALRDLALRTAAGLASVHRAGLVHGGCGPRAVLLGPDGTRLAGLGVPPPGDPAYLAPEQIEDEPVGAPADVFAWAATLVFAATGRPPFGTGPGAARRIAARRPDLGTLDGPLRDLALRCLDKNPAARPSAAALARALRDDRAPEPRPRPTRIPRYRWRMMVALATVVALGFVIGILV